MNTTTNTRHEVEVDTRIAAAHLEAFKTARHLAWVRKHRTHEIEEATIAADQAADHLDLVAAEYKGWSRFFMVPGGHIHSSGNCHTLRYDTDVRWLPTLSGLTEADAVEEHGEILCSHCFPTAPVAWTNGVSKQSIADKALKAIAKTPEGKAAIKAQRELQSIVDECTAADRRIKQLTAFAAEYAEQIAATGDTDCANGIAAAHARIVAAAAKFPKAKAKADAAEAALLAALAS
jgi:hypothetical protein